VPVEHVLFYVRVLHALSKRTMIPKIFQHSAKSCFCATVVVPLKVEAPALFPLPPAVDYHRRNGSNAYRERPEPWDMRRTGSISRPAKFVPTGHTKCLAVHRRQDDETSPVSLYQDYSYHITGKGWNAGHYRTGP